MRLYGPLRGLDGSIYPITSELLRGGRRDVDFSAIASAHKKRLFDIPDPAPAMLPSIAGANFSRVMFQSTRLSPELIVLDGSHSHAAAHHLFERRAQVVVHRDSLRRWEERTDVEGVRQQGEEHNQFSIDGKPTGFLADPTEAGIPNAETDREGLRAVIAAAWDAGFRRVGGSNWRDRYRPSLSKRAYIVAIHELAALR